jgi:hypothetical protein
MGYERRGWKMRSSAVPLLLALASVGTEAAAVPCDLTGDWICGGTCQVPGGKDNISQNGHALTLIGETGGVTQGWWLSDSTIVNVIDPKKDNELLGDVNRDCNRINWRNQTYWIRQQRPNQQ